MVLDVLETNGDLAHYCTVDVLLDRPKWEARQCCKHANLIRVLRIYWLRGRKQ